MFNANGEFTATKIAYEVVATSGHPTIRMFARKAQKELDKATDELLGLIRSERPRY
jgi:hypothetical protein